jgi:pilus assembly protein Flp/PilA
MVGFFTRLFQERIMTKFAQKMVEFLKKEDGPTAVEYAVMLALIIVVCIVAITALGQNASQTFSYVGGQTKPLGS